jgi:hypothetical protein
MSETTQRAKMFAGFAEESAAKASPDASAVVYALLAVMEAINAQRQSEEFSAELQRPVLTRVAEEIQDLRFEVDALGRQVGTLAPREVTT